MAEHQPPEIPDEFRRVPKEWAEFTSWLKTLSPKQKLQGIKDGRWPKDSNEFFISLIEVLSMPQLGEERSLREEILLTFFKGNNIPLSFARGNTPSMEELENASGEFVLEKINQAREWQEKKQLKHQNWQEGLKDLNRLLRISRKVIRQYGPTHQEIQERQRLKEQVDQLLSSLTEREQRVITLRHGLEDGRSRTLEEVGKELELSKSTIWRTEKRAFEKLRDTSLGPASASKI